MYNDHDGTTKATTLHRLLAIYFTVSCLLFHHDLLSYIVATRK